MLVIRLVVPSCVEIAYFCSFLSLVWQQTLSAYWLGHGGMGGVMLGVEGGGLLLQILLSHFAALKQPHRFTGFELMSHVILSRKKIHINCVAPNLNLI